MTGNMIADAVVALMCLFGLALLLAHEYADLRDKRRWRK